MLISLASALPQPMEQLTAVPDGDVEEPSAVSTAFQSFHDMLQDAIREDEERTRTRMEGLQAQLRQALAALCEAKTERDQGAQRTRELEERSIDQERELQQEREQRCAVEARLQHREITEAGLVWQLQSAEEKLRLSENKQQQMKTQLNEAQIALQREQEARHAAEAKLKVREDAMEVRSKQLQAAEESLRSSDKKQQILQARLDHAEKDCEQKASDKRSLSEELDDLRKENAQLRGMVQGGSNAHPVEASLAAGADALTWAKLVVGTLSEGVDRSGRQFELVCGDLLQSLGFDVQITGGPGDGGVDIRMTDSADRVGFVQCKCKGFKYKVDASDMQEFAQMTCQDGSRHVSYFIFAATTSFNSGALRLAEACGDGIQLWGREELVALLVRQQHALRHKPSIASVLQLAVKHSAPPSAHTLTQTRIQPEQDGEGGRGMGAAAPEGEGQRRVPAETEPGSEEGNSEGTEFVTERNSAQTLRQLHAKGSAKVRKEDRGVEEQNSEFVGGGGGVWSCAVDAMAALCIDTERGAASSQSGGQHLVGDRDGDRSVSTSQSNKENWPGNETVADRPMQTLQAVVGAESVTVQAEALVAVATSGRAEPQQILQVRSESGSTKCGAVAGPSVGMARTPSKRRAWSEAEEAALREAVARHGEGRWKAIVEDEGIARGLGERFSGMTRTQMQVCVKDKWRGLTARAQPTHLQL